MSSDSNLDKLYSLVEQLVHQGEIPENIASALNISVEKVYGIMYDLLTNDRIMQEL